jgi:AcrR family transcriptional regulator
MKPQIKMEARERKAQILSAALELSETASYARVTREQIAEKAGCPPTLISYHFGTMPALRRDIMREAIRTERLPVIAQGLALRDAHALKAPEELRQRAAHALAH